MRHVAELLGPALPRLGRPAAQLLPLYAAHSFVLRAWAVAVQGSAPARRRRGRTTRLIIGLGVLSLLTVAGLFHLARARTFQLFGVLITRVETTQKLVALTFDDGPNADRVDEVLSLLGTARAIFFVNGVNLNVDAGFSASLTTGQLDFSTLPL